MKIQIAMLTGLMALSTTVSAFACGGSGGYSYSGYQASGYSHSGYQVPSYGYAQPIYQSSYHVAPAASWHTPAPAVNHSSWTAPAAPAPSTVRHPIAVPSADATAQATNPTSSTRTLTSAETIALLKLLGPKDLQ